VPMLRQSEDFSVDEERHAVSLTDPGIAKMERLLGVSNIYTEDVTLAFHLDQALKAALLYKHDKDYVVKDGQVIIVDQFTGRLMHGRRYSQGLHQAIEAKEGVAVKEESHTLATITIQNYFRMYEKLAGMTGTAATEAEEFHKIYNLDVTQIPTHRAMIRLDKPDIVYKTEKGKLNALVLAVKDKHERGQPVLIGTISIEKNEMLGELLSKTGVPHNVLNAKQHEREAEIIAQAGRMKAVTLATNMAGRGVDIILGGNPPDEKEMEAVRRLGGLCVFGSERHEARRIDNQLRGRSGRQGDPGESRFFISLEDDLMRIFGGERVKGIMDRFGLPEDMPIENRMISKSIEKAQERVEGHNFDIRKHLVEYDDVINKQRAAIYKRRDDILHSLEREKPLQTIILDMMRMELERMVTECGSNAEELKQMISAIPIDISDYEPRGAGYEADAKRASEELYERAKVQYEKLCLSLDDEVKKHIEKTLLLRTIDTLWIAHLDAIEHLRVGIGLRGYGQRDPLIEYKREAFLMFKALQNEIDRQITHSIYKIFIAYQARPESAEAPKTINMEAKHETFDPYKEARHEQSGDSYVSSNRNPQTGSKLGRNDPCWCESGKKYKKCHGA
ncbi:MAG: SEC-C domain-containing protein, partial [Candidatus Jacksonbacteria bacterium]|nr:SEC-C domain-containing protein [Candidatus Jacksonbacteria bacterium]